MCSGLDRDANLATVDRLLSMAADQGAELAVLPETFVFMGGTEAEKRNMAEQQSESETLCFLSQQAAKHQMAIVGGTLLLKTDGLLVRNTCPAFDAAGELLALYDKIHLFDMDYQGESYHESALIEAGNDPVSVHLGDFKVGLSVCYDLRFPELFRAYVDDGCNVLCNVAAFTATTGRAHWQSLLQARAIENQCYVLAAAQSGTHPDGRQTWGHSLIIDPWGEVLAELAEGEGVVVAELSKKHLQHLRQALPVLLHRRLPKIRH
ncbi:carbon-nitrogen hydrolase family protein [Mariprofundus ferrooxydans]|nr:carbon-nitrogen hydrolase family protein [Mariprofundus ferrooxydans]